MMRIIVTGHMVRYPLAGNLFAFFHFVLVWRDLATRWYTSKKAAGATRVTIPKYAASATTRAPTSNRRRSFRDSQCRSTDLLRQSSIRRDLRRYTR